MIKIVTDSNCNLTPEQLRQYDIRVAPLTIQFGLEAYSEGLDMDRDLFYAKVAELGVVPGTSQPSPGVFAAHYRELAAQGHTILVITITQKHSGTYQSALLARDLAPRGGCGGVRLGHDLPGHGVYGVGGGARRQQGAKQGAHPRAFRRRSEAGCPSFSPRRRSNTCA